MKLLLLFLSLIYVVSARSRARSALDRTGRIIGGRTAPEGSAPYQASLKLVNFHWCGGVIINNRWLLTAGHCLEGWDPTLIDAYVGSNQLEGNGVVYKSEKFIVHENFDDPPFHNDIGMVKTVLTIAFTDRVLAIPLRQSRLPDKAFPVVLTGWGSTQEGEALPNNLQAIDLTNIELDECRSLHKPEDRPDISDGHMCTFTRTGEGVCDGDSGSPLVFQGELVGLVNWGIPCGRGVPDVHARVESFIDWINRKIAENI